MSLILKIVSIVCFANGHTDLWLKAETEPFAVVDIYCQEYVGQPSFFGGPITLEADSQGTAWLLYSSLDKSTIFSGVVR